MQQFSLYIYNILIVPIFLIVLRILAPFNKKIKEGIVERRKYFSKLKKQVNLIPDSAHIVLFHSASVGEWEQAAPIITELKSQNSNIFIVASFFSPSGYNIVKNKHIDLKLYLPFDSKKNAKKFFKILKPKVWVISKYDVWPNLVCQAHKKNIPVILTSAELAPDSKRHKGLSKIFNSSFYKYIDYILPVSEDYKQRFLQIFPFPDRLIVAGDARYDQIYAKTQNVITTKEKIPIFFDDSGVTLICGSIWQSDEKIIFPAIHKMLEKYQHFSVILVPHEIDEDHINNMIQYFTKKNHSIERFTKFQFQNGTNSRIAIIDTIGILYKLYRKTEFAYIGGGFSTGVHNVLEPAAYAQPVVFGPKYKNSFEAREFVRIECGFSVNNENEAEQIFDKLISNQKFRYNNGKIAQEFLKNNLGATDIILKLLNEKYLNK